MQLLGKKFSLLSVFLLSAFISFSQTGVESIQEMRERGAPSGGTVKRYTVILANARPTFYIWRTLCNSPDDSMDHIRIGQGCWERATSPYLSAGRGIDRVVDTFQIDSTVITWKDTTYGVATKHDVGGMEETILGISEGIDEFRAIPSYSISQADISHWRNVYNSWTLDSANLIRSTETYSNPSWLSSVSINKIPGASSTTYVDMGVSALKTYSDSTFRKKTEAIPYSSLSGVPSINSSTIVSALGFTPLQSYIETDPTFNTKFSAKTTNDLAEGSQLYYTPARSRTAVSAGTGISYNSSTGVITNSAPDQTVSFTAGSGISITGTYPNFTISATFPTPVITISSRTVNTTFTPSSTKATIGIYSITCNVTNPLLLGSSTATAFLEYSTNGGTTWQAASQVGNSSSVALTVTVAITNGQTGTLIGVIPANALTRIRTATTGTASAIIVSQQEIQY